MRYKRSLIVGFVLTLGLLAACRRITPLSSEEAAATTSAPVATTEKAAPILCLGTETYIEKKTTEVQGRTTVTRYLYLRITNNGEKKVVGVRGNCRGINVFGETKMECPFEKTGLLLATGESKDILLDTTAWNGWDDLRFEISFTAIAYEDGSVDWFE